MRQSPLTLLCLLALPLTAVAEAPLVVSGARVELGELSGDAPEQFRSIDLGPAPPPGATALLDRELVAGRLRAAGAHDVKLPRLLRVVGASRRFTPAELTEMVRPAVENALPRGVRLLHLDARMPLVAAPDALVGHAEIPKPPKREGLFKTAVVVPIVVDGQVASRVTVSATLDVTALAARPDIGRGTRITLVIDRRSARVGATGIALADTDIGETSDFRVDKTGRIVRAHVESADVANVVSP